MRKNEVIKIKLKKEIISNIPKAIIPKGTIGMVHKISYEEDPLRVIAFFDGNNENISFLEEDSKNKKVVAFLEFPKFNAYIEVKLIRDQVFFNLTLKKGVCGLVPVIQWEDNKKVSVECLFLGKSKQEGIVFKDLLQFQKQNYKGEITMSVVRHNLEMV